MSRPARYSLSRLPACLPLALFLLGYFALRSIHFDFFPIWDGRGYYESILNAQGKPFRLLNYSTVGHNDQAWLLLAGVANMAFPRSVFAYNLWVALLGTAGVAAFYAITGALFTQVGQGERLLVTALFAFHPAVLANQVFITADTGLLIFWVWFLYALLKEKTALACAAGVLLLFSKEPAIAHLAVLFLFCVLRQPAGERPRWAKRHGLAVGVPYLLLGLFLCYKSSAGLYLFNAGFLQKPDPVALAIAPDESLITYLLMALVLDFSWIMTGGGLLLAPRLFLMPKEVRRQALALAWLLGATLCVTVAVRHYSNVRYVLPVFPALVLYFVQALQAVPSGKCRTILLAALLVLLGWQNIRSIDPVSNTAFCHAQFGAHKVVIIPDFGVCHFDEEKIPLQKDQLVYNLEFLHIPALINAMLQDIRPDDHTVIISGSGYDYDVFSGLDRDFRPSYREIKVTPRPYAMPPPGKAFTRRFMKSLPERIYVLELPADDTDSFRGQLLAYYSGISERIYDKDGYRLTLLTLYHKNKGDWCEPL